MKRHSAEYLEYLDSSEWRAKRELALERAGHRCQVCNLATRLDVHHRTYENLGVEDVGDLTVLCRECHEAFHDRLARHETERVSLSGATKKKNKTWLSKK